MTLVKLSEFSLPLCLLLLQLIVAVSLDLGDLVVTIFCDPLLVSFQDFDSFQQGVPRVSNLLLSLASLGQL